MTPSELFRQLLDRVEGPSLDFKRQHYGSDKASQFEFVKDVMAMANTPRDGDAYIVLGVDYVVGEGAQLSPLDQQVDDTIYANLLSTDLVSPLPRVTYLPVRHESGHFGPADRIASEPVPACEGFGRGGKERRGAASCGYAGNRPTPDRRPTKFGRS